MGIASVIVSFFLFALGGSVGFLFIPKSPDQVLYRTCLLLTLVCTWTMWALTYMAQMNPLIVPEKIVHNNLGGH